MSSLPVKSDRIHIEDFPENKKIMRVIRKINDKDNKDSKDNKDTIDNKNNKDNKDNKDTEDNKDVIEETSPHLFMIFKMDDIVVEKKNKNKNKKINGSN